MGSVSLYATKYAYVAKNVSGNMSSQTTQRINNRPASYDPRFLLSFEAVPDALKYKPITRARLYMYVTVSGRVTCGKISLSDSDFDANTVSYGTAPAKRFSFGEFPWSWSLGENAYSAQQSAWVNGVGGYYDPAKVVEILAAKTIWPSDLDFYSDTSIAQGGAYVTTESDLIIDTPLSSRKPYLLLEYSDDNAGLTVSATSQTGGYINPHVAQSFSWSARPQTLYTAATPEQANAVFEWKAAGSSTVHSVSVPGAASSVTIAAETFPGASSIQWRVRVQSTSDVWTATDWIELSTADSLAVATLERPVSTVVDASSPITFVWSESNDSGSVPTGADIQVSTNAGSTWTQLAHVSGTVSEYTVAAGRFSVGDVYWRVRVYNIDNVAGPWSESFFTAFAAPDPPSLSVEAVPFARLTWQSEGQQAFQVAIDGVEQSPVFGTSKRWVCRLPLADGEHVAAVRIQNYYGLWSQYSSIPFTIENTPGSAIELSAAFDVDASLAWGYSAVSDYLVFRDGALIGHTSANAFIDRFVLGSHEYYVVNRLASGNYTKSNAVSGNLCTDKPIVAAFEGGSWISLKLSDRSSREQSFSWSRVNSLRHFAGAAYPVLELSPYRDETGTYDAAFECARAAADFEALLGKVVILKSRAGKVLVGALTELRTVVNDFYIVYRFTVSRVHFEDYIDADENN